MDWQSILPIAASIVAIGAVAGIGLMRDRLQNLDALSEAQEKRITFLEKAAARDAIENAELRAEVATLTHDADVLRSAVRDRANYETISSQVDEVLRVVVKIDKRLP